jgi:exosortase
MDSALPLKKTTVPYLLFAGTTLLFAYGSFLAVLVKTWLGDPEFSYGILIPLIVAVVIWGRRDQLRGQEESVWLPGLWMVIACCALQVLASMSGSLLLSGIAFTTSVIGIAGFVWGRSLLRVVAGPLALLVLMVPLPSYMVGELAWRLQTAASTVSGTALGLLGVPVYQDGNLLRLSNYVLEVKQACSGSRSIFALLALACVLGVSTEKKWWIRVFLVMAAPVLAVGANVVRIVGTGLIATHWGDLAANESLHAAWGILVFVIAVVGLLGLQRLLRWTTQEPA